MVTLPEFTSLERANNHNTKDNTVAVNIPTPSITVVSIIIYPTAPELGTSALLNINAAEGHETQTD